MYTIKLEDIEHEILERNLLKGKEGIEYLISLIPLDNDQFRIFLKWKEYVSCMNDLQNEDQLCRDALLLSKNEFHSKYQFIDRSIAAEYALIYLARLRKLSEEQYKMYVEQIYFRKHCLKIRPV